MWAEPTDRIQVRAQKNGTVGTGGDSTGHGVDADHFWRLLLASSDKNVGSIGLRDGGSRQGSCHEPSKRLSNKVVFLHDQDREVFR